MNLPIQPAALAELDAAIEFYESRRPGLGLAFLDAVAATVAHASDVPAAGEQCSEGLVGHDA